MSETRLPTRADFRFAERLRVRWVEVDVQKVVFNGHYLMYFDTAVAGWWRALGMPYHETMSALQGDFFVRKAELDYLGSARYDDRLEVGIRCARVGSSSLRLAAAVFRDERLLVHGALVYVFVDPGPQRAKPVPELLREWFTDFEAGQPMIAFDTGDWRTLGEDAAAIRRAVFTDEQGIDAALDNDGADDNAVHVLARNRMGLALGTGRLVAYAPGVDKVGRMAVVASMRGTQVGRGLLDALVAAARERGSREVMLHAQASAVGFYRRAGFVERGARFVEAGLEHQEMVLALN